MKYIKTLFNIGLNDWFVSMYSDGKKIILLEVNPVTSETGYEKIFNDRIAYEKWIDEVVDNETATYNQAYSLQLLFRALKRDCKTY